MTHPASNLCPECGISSWVVKDHDRIVQEKLEIGQRFKNLRATHGRDQAEWDLREISLTESMKYLQRKVRKQADVITKLENKLKKFKQRPYEREEDQ